MSTTNGPVPLQSPDYIERKFELSTRRSLLKRDWVLLLGPRQHGKTSALYRIQEILLDSGFRCGFVDLQRLPPALTFEQILEWFANTVAHSMGNIGFTPVGGSELMDWISAAIPMPGAPTVIFIDEASSIRDEAQRNSFYGQIRAIKGAAAASDAESLSSNIQFVFAGTFRPETLVDDLNSPFNVCIRIDTEDLDFQQVARLTSTILQSPEEEIDAIARIIFESVGGQPHLIQSILSIAENEIVSNRIAAIEAEILRLSTEGSEHIRSLFRTVIQDANLVRIASTVASQGRITNDPANIDYKYMTTIGLLRRAELNLVFRNTLYQNIAQTSTQLRPEVAITESNHTFLLPLDESQFAFVTDVQFREICASSYNGAVAASNNGNFRLAIVGFGMALEAILMDWLVKKGRAVISAAIGKMPGAIQPKFNHNEKKDDPLTWRLVNLMKVGRFLQRVKGPMDLPESLREFRNWVHPAVIKKSFQPEKFLAPEALACSALLSIIIRDIQN
jgi:hypothetical protein